MNIKQIHFCIGVTWDTFSVVVMHICHPIVPSHPIIRHPYLTGYIFWCKHAIWPGYIHVSVILLLIVCPCVFYFQLSRLLMLIFSKEHKSVPSHPMCQLFFFSSVTYWSKYKLPVRYFHYEWFYERLGLYIFLSRKCQPDWLRLYMC